MTESKKKQLLIIGNGFDLSCGLKSTYSSFFNERYKNILPKAEKVIFKKAEDDGGYTIAMKIMEADSMNYPFHDLNSLLSEGEKVFNKLDLFFVAEHFYRNSNVEKWCDVEELITEIVSIVNNDTSNEVPKYVSNKFNKYIKYQSDYLKLTADKLFGYLKEFENAFKEYITKISDNHDYVNKEVNKLEELMHNFTIANIISFNYTFGPQEYKNSFNTNMSNVSKKINSYRNIHGSIAEEDNIIFGIDSLNISPKSEMYRFTKTYRIMANNLNGSYIDVLDNDIDTITFYGHSLAEADFSYFESIFDYYNIYGSKMTLEFYCVLYEDGVNSDNNNLRRKNYEAICKLLYKYGESIGGIKGKNLVHKLLLENRLKIRYEKTR